MSIPQPPKPAKLIVGFFLKEKSLAADVARDLSMRLGPVETISPWLKFDFTSYYEKEMGVPLYRRLMVFRKHVQQTRLVAVKHITNELEIKYQRGGGRQVNIDPGYLLPERLVLATGKNFTHRIYIGEGVYADLTLIYQKGAFRTLPWTYPDYADRRLIDFLTLVRNKYMVELKKTKNRSDPSSPA